MSAAYRFSRRGLVFVLLGLLATACLVNIARTTPSTSQFSSVRVGACRLPSDDHPPWTTADVNAELPPKRRLLRRDVSGRQMTNDTVSILGSPPNYDSEGVSSARSNATRSIIGSRRGLPNADVTKLPGRRPLPPPADFAPATVYFVWCNTQRRKFSFPHYLSVRAAIHAVGADAVWFYFALQPTADRWSHETWLGELEAEFPFFRRRPLFDLGHLDACVGNRPADDFVAWLVSTHGGIYVDVETAIADFRPSLRSLDVLAAYTEDRGNSSRNELRSKAVRRLRLLMAKKGQLCGGSANDIAKPRVQVTTCLAYGESDVVTTRNHKPPICVVLPSALLPKDLWTDGTNGDDATMVSTVGRYLRTAFYGRPEIPKPVADYSNLVPNTGHMVWVDGGEMKFVFFLSVLSLLHCAGVDAVYVHGDQPPSGVYWKLLLATQTDRVKFVQRENMGQVYGQNVALPSHVSDVWRADILFRYGGVYADTDTVFVRRLTNELRAYDAVGSYDWPQWFAPFPDLLNLGLALGKPGSQFWRLCQESMKWFRDDDFSWNGLRQPYRVYERHPDLLRVEPRLQVICFRSHCHPTWWPNYHDASVHHLNPPAGVSPLDWRNDTFAFHFTDPTPAEYADPATLMSATGMFAEIGQHVLKLSGMAEYFRRNGTNARNWRLKNR